MIADDRRDLRFPIAQGILPWYSFFGVGEGERIGKIAIPSFSPLASRNGLEVRNADARINSGDDPSTSKFDELPSSNSGVYEARVLFLEVVIRRKLTLCG